MKIEVKNINSYGDYHTERIIINVLDDCNIGEYMIQYGKGRVANYKNSFRLPKINLKKDDRIILYTRNGEDIVYRIDGHTTYIFHLGLNECINKTFSEIFIIRHITHSTVEIR